MGTMRHKSRHAIVIVAIAIAVMAFSASLLLLELEKVVPLDNVKTSMDTQAEAFHTHYELLELAIALDRYQLNVRNVNKELLSQSLSAFDKHVDHIRKSDGSKADQSTEAYKYFVSNALPIKHKIEQQILLSTKVEFPAYLEIWNELADSKVQTTNLSLANNQADLDQDLFNMYATFKEKGITYILFFAMLLSSSLLIILFWFKIHRSKRLSDELEHRAQKDAIRLASMNVQLENEIAKRRVTEKERQTSDDRFRDFAQISSDWLWETDAQLQGIYFSDRFTEESDNDTQSIAEVTDIEAMRAYLEPSVWIEHSKILETHQPFKDFRYTRISKNGTSQHISASGTPCFDENGAFLGYRCSARNTSRFEKAEKMITDARLQLARAVENLPSAFGLYDADDRLVICNQEYKNIYHPVADLMEPGTSYEDLLWAYGRSQNFLETDADIGLWVMQRLDRRKNPARNLHYEYKPEHWVEVNDYNLPDGGIIFVGYEITDKRQLQDQLGQAQKMEAVGQLTGGIAHDFNNILAIILGNSDLLYDELSEEENGHLIKLTESIIKAAEHGADLTHRLLAFSRKSPLSPDVINLEEKITSMTDLMRRSIGEKVEIKTVIADDLWSCKADASQVENAVLNLCINARDAMPNGGTVTIATDNVTVNHDYSSLHSDVKKGDYVRITVTDTGTGIPPETLERVLEPFFTTKSVGKGSGLGLSMVYGFANQSNGHITIDSKVDHGTTIGLYLPRSDAPIEFKEYRKNTDVSDTKKETILVVEDDPELRALVLTTLKRIGYIVLEAKDGVSAKAILDEQKPIDLLLTDVILPGDLDGPAISKYADDIYPHIKTLFMSGYTENAFEDVPLTNDGYNLLNKPFRRKELAAKIRELLDEVAP